MFVLDILFCLLYVTGILKIQAPRNRYKSAKKQALSFSIPLGYELV